MTSGSIGSHRAFMGVCVTLSVCLSLVLFLGWRWYFNSVSNRNTLLELAQKAEARARDLEKMGLLVDVPKPAELPTATHTPALTQQPSELEPGARSPDNHAPLYPGASSIKVMPLQENGEDVVQAVALLEQFWQVENWRDRIPMVIESDRVTALMQDFYETQNGKDPLPGGMLNKARYLIDGHEILYFSYTSNRPTGTLEVALRRGPQGKFLIDWESLVGYGEMSFADFRAQRPDKPVMLRAYVRQFEYYNFEFSDSSKFLCVKLSSENGEHSVYGYSDRTSALGRWLESELATTGPSGFKGFTLSVAFPPNAQSNQCVLLDKVVAARWLILP
jgi:hypothetical protein